jgi:hypothetical protein
MQCTPEEIEKKRRIALEKLARKKFHSPLKPNLENLNGEITAPQHSLSPSKQRFNFKAHEQVRHNAKPYDKPKEALQFYGKDKVVTGRCSLITEERFVVELSGFSTPALDVFKAIPTRNYSE